MMPVALDDADGEADEVELAGLHGAGVLGHLAADQRAAGLAAALGDARDELLDVVGVELADGDVVEEEQRLGALADEVVDAHGDEVDADGVEPAGGLGDRAPWCRRRRWTTRAPGCGSRWPAKANRPPKPPMSPMTSGRKVERTLRLDALDRLLAGVDVDAGALVGLAHRRSPSARRARAASRLRRPARTVVAPRARALRSADRHLDRVLAGEAGVAEAGAGRAGGVDRAGRG